MTFNDGSTALGSPVSLNGTGQAVCATILPTAGTHFISAVYSGDNNFAASTSSPITQIVNKATFTFSNLSSPTIIQSTATVTISGSLTSGSMYPTGETVMITLNGVNQNANVGSGGNFSASFNTNSLTATGSPYTINYSFGGSDNYNSAFDSRLLTVNPPLSVLRTLPAIVAKGQTFNISVSFTAPANNFNAIGLSDFMPAGWSVSANNSWNAPNSNTLNVTSNATSNRVDYIWNGPYAQGTNFTAVYQVTVSANTTPGLYYFNGGILQYYVGNIGITTSPITGNFQITVVNGAAVNGSTYEAKGTVLTGVTLTLDGSTQVVSSNGTYQLDIPAIGSHTVVASKAGYRSETQTININSLTGTYTLDFKAIHGLVPNAPDITYVLACINKWKYPPTDGTGLGEPEGISKALSVINAWLYPY